MAIPVGVIVTRTVVSIVNSVISIYTYFDGVIEEFISFFITDVDQIIDNISFSEGDLGLTVSGLVTSASLNDSGELIIIDEDTDLYEVDGVGELIYDGGLDSPVVSSFSDINPTSFRVSWGLVTGATRYYIDVSTDSQFNTYVSGYQNLDIGNVVDYLVEGLVVDTIYYVRVRSYNEVQVSIDSNIVSGMTLESIEDFDGNVYSYVTIGTQQWLVENFRGEHYIDGTPIPNLILDADWIADTTGAMCYYDNDEITYKLDYGALYNWYAVDNAHGLGITGWRVPTKDDFTTLANFLGGSGICGGILKEVGLTTWQAPNTGATDLYGFKAVGAGDREHNTGSFSHKSTNMQMWSSIDYSSSNAYMRLLASNHIQFIEGGYDKNYGLSVRLMRDI